MVNRDAVLRGEEPLAVPRRVRVERQAGEETAPNGEAFHVRIRASTAGVARDGGVVPLSAWADGGLDAFRRNPVVLLAHRRADFPIAVSVFDRLDAAEGALVSWWRFHEETEESRVARQLYEGGWMRAASVGIRILEWHEPEEAEALQADLGTSEEILWVADRAELVEQSAVAVPADPGALASKALRRALSTARACGVDVTPLTRTLDRLRAACRYGDADACRALRSRSRGGDGTGGRRRVMERVTLNGLTLSVERDCRGRRFAIFPDSSGGELEVELRVGERPEDLLKEAVAEAARRRALDRRAGRGR